MSATNDEYMKRFALPGCPTPLLPEDVVNKKYVDAAIQDKFLNVISNNDQSNDTTDLQSTNLQLEVPYGRYALHLWAWFTGTSTQAGIKSQFYVPPNTPLIDMRWQWTEKNAQPATLNETATPTTTLATGNDGRVEITGWLQNFDANPAYVSWRFAKNVAVGTPLVLKRNSWMTLTKFLL